MEANTNTTEENKKAKSKFIIYSESEFLLNIFFYYNFSISLKIVEDKNICNKIARVIKDLANYCIGFVFKVQKMRNGKNKNVNIELIPEKNLHDFFHPIEDRTKKKILILDLDETLISSSFESFPNPDFILTVNPFLLLNLNSF